jgi:lysophospholipase L1-like esterase
VQLANLLRGKGVLVQNPDFVARAGWTTADLLQALSFNPTKPRYDLVSLLIGVNNQYQGKPLQTYRSEFATLLKIATDKAGGNPGRVFVLSIPDWGVTPAGTGQDRSKIAQEIDAFNAAARAVCAQQGVLFIDVTTVSRTASGDASLVASDQLHFSGKMYALWAEQAAEPVRKLLPQP